MGGGDYYWIVNVSGQNLASRVVLFPTPGLRSHLETNPVGEGGSKVPFCIHCLSSKERTYWKGSGGPSWGRPNPRSCAHMGAEAGVGRPRRVSVFAPECGSGVSRNLGEDGAVAASFIFYILML